MLRPDGGEDRVMEALDAWRFAASGTVMNPREPVVAKTTEVVARHATGGALTPQIPA